MPNNQDNTAQRTPSKLDTTRLQQATNPATRRVSESIEAPLTTATKETEPLVNKVDEQSNKQPPPPQDGPRPPTEPTQASSAPKAKLRRTENIREVDAYDDIEPNPDVSMKRVPELPREVTYQQLATELRAIYAGLVMVEQKCSQVVESQAKDRNNGRDLQPNQWQALIALHKTLLNEHHDFFLASQHPNASQQLRQLPNKYTMPARMWRNGIHKLLELLRHNLPNSLEHMTTFIYIAYGTITLLYETVPDYRNTWIECLGDLARYRMAIEEDLHDREIWTGVAREWYFMANSSSPTVGRINHHLAILARPFPIEQLSYYGKSVCVMEPFSLARGSAGALFAPLLSDSPPPAALYEHSWEMPLLQCHGIIFMNKGYELFDKALESLQKSLNGHFSNGSMRAEIGWQIGVANSCALLGYGAEGNALMRVFRSQHRKETDPESAANDADKDDDRLQRALQLSHMMSSILLTRKGDPNVLTYLYVTLVFLVHVSKSKLLAGMVRELMPWQPLVDMLNYVIDAAEPETEKNDTPARLPDDWFIRGLVWGDHYLSGIASFDDEEVKKENGDRHIIETEAIKPTYTKQRQLRILSIGAKLASLGNLPIAYTEKPRRFAVKA